MLENPNFEIQCFFRLPSLKIKKSKSHVQFLHHEILWSWVMLKNMFLMPASWSWGRGGISLNPILAGVRASKPICTLKFVIPSSIESPDCVESVCEWTLSFICVDGWVCSTLVPFYSNHYIFNLWAESTENPAVANWCTFAEFLCLIFVYFILEYFKSNTDSAR